jgi:pSer/pThr/pTyr-binding forkhead associated (FHA) protein
VWLRILTGPDAGKTVRVSGPSFVVGRRRGADIVLRDPAVSPRHAAFRASDGGYLLEDLGSEHGTFVAGVRIRGSVELRGSEQLCFGETFAALVPGVASTRSRKRVYAIAGAAAVLAAAGVTAGVLAPRTGGGPAQATVAAPRASPPAAREESLDPAAETVAPATDTGPETTATQPTTQPEPVRLSDDFSDPSSGWEVFDEPAVSAEYDDGEFVMRITDSRWYATATLDRLFAAPVVTVVVRNPALNARAGFGVVCRYRGERRFDVLAVGTDGTYAILRQNGDQLTVLSGDGQWEASPLVPVAAPEYALRAECRGSRLTLSVDGRQVGSVPTRATSGEVGFFAAGASELRFDDVVVEGEAA